MKIVIYICIVTIIFLTCIWVYKYKNQEKEFNSRLNEVKKAYSTQLDLVVAQLVVAEKTIITLDSLGHTGRGASIYNAYLETLKQYYYGRIIRSSVNGKNTEIKSRERNLVLNNR